MTLEEKLRLIKSAAAKSAREQVLDRELAYLARRAQRRKQLPADRAPRGIEEYVEGRTEQNDFGEFFVARQALPFGRPYGSLRIGDIAGASLEALNIFLRPARNGTGSLSLPAPADLPEPSRLAFLDTETTGLAGGTGTVAFLIGVATVEAGRFVVRQFFLRDYPEEKAVLAAIAHGLGKKASLLPFVIPLVVPPVCFRETVATPRLALFLPAPHRRKGLEWLCLATFRARSHGRERADSSTPTEQDFAAVPQSYS